MFSKLTNFDFRQHNVPDWMHNLKCIFEMVLDIICGGHGGTARAKAWNSKRSDQRHRAECELFGIFEAVWLNQRRELPADVREALLRVTDDDVRGAIRVTLERWCRAVGEDTSGLLVGELRTKVFNFLQELRQVGTLFYTPKEPEPLPWRLTSAAFAEVDKRILNIAFPHDVSTVIDHKGISLVRKCLCCMHVSLPLRILTLLLRHLHLQGKHF